MADLRDERGNPIQLTDEFGKPVQLTDEYGNPMHIKGVATTTHTATLGHMLHPHHQLHPSEEEKKEKEKEKEKERETEAAHSAPGTRTQQSKTPSTVPGHDQKKGVLEKIKEKLPGHHHHTPH